MVRLEAVLLRRDLVVTDRKIRNAIHARGARRSGAVCVGFNIPHDDVGALNHGSRVVFHDSLDRTGLRPGGRHTRRNQRSEYKHFQLQHCSSTTHEQDIGTAGHPALRIGT